MYDSEMRAISKYIVRSILHTICTCIVFCVFCIIMYTKYSINEIQYSKMDFFQGLKNIYEMTEGVETELRIDLEKSTGEKGYGVWQSFSHSEPLNYTIQIGTYSGTIGNTKTQNDV